jgi:hypothetical protein
VQVIQTLQTYFSKSLFSYLIQFSTTEYNNEVQFAYRSRFGYCLYRRCSKREYQVPKFGQYQVSVHQQIHEVTVRQGIHQLSNRKWIRQVSVRQGIHQVTFDARPLFPSLGEM